MSNPILQLANKNLSNNFTGDNNMNSSIADLTAAIGNKFGMTVKSTASTNTLIGVLPSYFKTLGLDASGPALQLHYHNRQALLDAGIRVDAIVDDGQWNFDGVAAGWSDGDVTIYGTDPSKKIRDFLEYIKYYTRSIDKILIHSPNIAAYQGSLRLQQPNPYYDSQRMPLDLNQYFRVDQYQDNKIELDFSGITLDVTPDLLMLVPVPANSTVSIDFFFR